LVKSRAFAGWLEAKIASPKFGNLLYGVPKGLET
jgi:hypothetical protein